MKTLEGRGASVTRDCRDVQSNHASRHYHRNGCLQNKSTALLLETRVLLQKIAHSGCEVAHDIGPSARRAMKVTGIYHPGILGDSNGFLSERENSFHFLTGESDSRRAPRGPHDVAYTVE